MPGGTGRDREGRSDARASNGVGREPCRGRRGPQRTVVKIRPSATRVNPFRGFFAAGPGHCPTMPATDRLNRDDISASGTRRAKPRGGPRAIGPGSVHDRRPRTFATRGARLRPRPRARRGPVSRPRLDLPGLAAGPLEALESKAARLGLYLEVGLPSPNPARRSRIEGRPVSAKEHARDLIPHVEAAARLGVHHARIYLGDRHDRFRADPRGRSNWTLAVTYWNVSNRLYAPVRSESRSRRTRTSRSRSCFGSSIGSARTRPGSRSTRATS